VAVIDFFQITVPREREEHTVACGRVGSSACNDGKANRRAHPAYHDSYLDQPVRQRPNTRQMAATRLLDLVVPLSATWCVTINEVAVRRCVELNKARRGLRYSGVI
jgi:hypothetical protein